MGALKVWNSTTAQWEYTASGGNQTTTVSGTAPTGPVLGQQWFDTTVGYLKLWSGSAWVAVAATTTTTLIPIQAADPTGQADGHVFYDSDYVLTIGVSDLSATGVKDSTTFLRGDNTFANIVGGFVRVVGTTSYPARPAGATYVEWIGPTLPTAQAGLSVLANDTWIQT
jgi:hypothetical protein